MKITDALRGQVPKNHIHYNLGAVATLGLRLGSFESGPVVIKGPPAWSIRGRYCVLAVPTSEGRIRVLPNWPPALVFGRNISMQAMQDPRRVFITGGSPDVRR